MDYLQTQLKILRSDAPDEVKLLAVLGLRGRTDPAVIESLTRTLADSGPRLKLAAAEALAESAASLSRTAIDAVTREPSLSNADAVGIIGDLLRAFGPALTRALADASDLEACVRAAGLIVHMPWARAHEALEAALEDDGRAGILAAEVLALNGHEDALDRLIASLSSADEPPESRLIAAHALVVISAVDPEDDDVARALTEALFDVSLVSAWYEATPSLAADLIDRAAETAREDIRRASRNAYDAMVSSIDLVEDDEIDELLDTLLQGDYDDRGAAVDAIVAVSTTEDVVSAIHDRIQNHFDDRSVDLNEFATVLKAIKDHAAVPDLVKLAGHHDWMTRSNAIGGLAAHGARVAAATVLDRLLNDPELLVRKAAANAVPEVCPPAADTMRALVRCVLSDPSLAGGFDPRVVAPAGTALRLLRLTEAIPSLRPALGDDNPAVRRSVAWALGELMAMDVLPELCRMVESDPDAGVRQGVAWGLGQLRHEAAVTSLICVITSEHAGLRGDATWALGQIRDPRAVPSLLAALDVENDAGVENRIVWTLGQIKDQRAAPVLHRKLFTSGSAEIRARCAQALGSIGDARSGTVVLERLIAETDPQTREALIHALGELRWEAARDYLAAQLFEDPNARVQRAAAQVLGRIGDNHSLRLLVDVTQMPQVEGGVRDAARAAAQRLRYQRRSAGGSS